MQKIVLGGCIALIVLVGILLYSHEMQKNTPVVRTPSSPQSAPSTSPVAASARYLPFSPDVLSQSTDTRRVLFFYANWCPTCRPADADFSAKAGNIPSDVTVIRVNYNDTETDQAEKDLARRYAITYQHTFVQIDRDGKEITRWNGGQLDTLLARIQ